MVYKDLVQFLADWMSIPYCRRLPVQGYMAHAEAGKIASAF